MRSSNRTGAAPSRILTFTDFASSSHSFTRSSRSIDEAANLLQRCYKTGIVADIMDCEHACFLAELRYVDAMISRMTLASENGIFFVTGRTRESCKGTPSEFRSRTI